MHSVEGAMHSGKKVMISRIRSPFYIFFFNPVYVAARSLRSLRTLTPQHLLLFSIANIFVYKHCFCYLNVENVKQKNSLFH